MLMQLHDAALLGRRAGATNTFKVQSEAKLLRGSTARLLLQELVAVLRKEVERCENLLLSEPDSTKCKWPTLTLARLHELLHSLQGAPFSTLPL